MQSRGISLYRQTENSGGDPIGDVGVVGMGGSLEGGTSLNICCLIGRHCKPVKPTSDAGYPLIEKHMSERKFLVFHPRHDKD